MVVVVSVCVWGEGGTAQHRRPAECCRRRKPLQACSDGLWHTTRSAPLSRAGVAALADGARLGLTGYSPASGLPNPCSPPGPKLAGGRSHGAIPLGTAERGRIEGNS